MPIGKCSDCKYCEARVDYAWCTDKGKEVNPNDVNDCCYDRRY